jgi:hypothetical protein
LKNKPTLPKLAVAITALGGWIVGGAADPTEQNPQDIDILIPFHLWSKVAPLIPSDARPNKFGGWRFMQASVEYDVWPGDLESMMQKSFFHHAWHPLTGARWVQEKG